MTIHNYWSNVRLNNQRAVMQDYGVISNIWFLFPQGGGPRGSFTTFADLKPNLKSRDTILLSGVLREQAVAPADVYDVTIIGAANRPRQATSGGTPVGGGATWMAPASGAAATTPLLEIYSQGWNIQNIEFTPHTNSAALRFTRSASVDTTDGSHFTVEGCFFAANGGSGQIGIEDNGGSSFGLIRNNRFQGLTGTGILGLSTASNVPQMWDIDGNTFNGCTNDIAMSLTEGRVRNNQFRGAADNANNKINLILLAAQGSNNQVINNILRDAAANVTIAKGYKPGSDDTWRNYVTDTAAYIVTVPA